MCLERVRNCPHCWSAGKFYSSSQIHSHLATIDWFRHLVSVFSPATCVRRSSTCSSSPGVVVANAQSVGASLLVWLVSGILGWTGASSFAELGSAIPVNGGAQAYLAYAYNPLVSYLFAWTAIVALKPGGNGVIALIFAEYVNRLIYHATSADTESESLPQWSIKVTASLAVACVTMICIWTRNLGTRAAVVFTSVKVVV